eukprot:RCo015361
MKRWTGGERCGALWFKNTRDFHFSFVNVFFSRFLQSRDDETCRILEEEELDWFEEKKPSACQYIPSAILIKQRFSFVIFDNPKQHPLGTSALQVHHFLQG